VKPKVADGVPDYSAAAMKKQKDELPAFSKAPGGHRLQPLAGSTEGRL